MFILGLLSLIQIVFLPGFLILQAIKYKANLTRVLIFSFGLSLIANYCGVLFLMVVGLYTRPIVGGIFLLELILLIRLYSIQIKTGLLTSIDHYFLSWMESLYNIFNSYFTFIKIDRNNKTQAARILIAIIYSAVVALAIIAILYVIFVFIRNIGTIFGSWDAIISWNRWAVEWFHNIYPTSVLHYPQLLPANWSISYIFMNMPLQFFPKSIMPLFMLYILLLMFDLGISKKSVAYFIGVTMTAVILKLIYGVMITEGMADIPVAFFGFLAVFCLLAAQNEIKKKEVTNYILLGAVFSCGAAVTKQAGLFIVMLYPLLTYLTIVRKRLDFSARDWIKLFFWFLVIICIIVIPFYVYMQLKINSGLDKSEIDFVTNIIFHGKGFPQRFNDAFEMLSTALHGKDVLISLLLISVIGLTEKTYRWFLLLIAFPYLMIWALFYSYDIRNCALALPFLALGIGIGIEQFVKYIIKGSLKNYYIIGTIFIILIMLNFWFTPAFMQAKHTYLEKQLNDPVLNQLIYNYSEQNGINSKILTDYQILGVLPGLKDHYQFQLFVTQYGNEFALYVNNIHNIDIGYILANNNGNKQIIDDINMRIKTGEFEYIFHQSGYSFIKINRGKM